MGYTGKEDIYIQLMQDITGLDVINPNTRILQSQDDLANATPEEKKLNDALKNSRNDLCTKLGIKTSDMPVGSPPAETTGYIEPCPIQYTGDISKGQKFHCIFIGLNPHLDKERWRNFPSDENNQRATFADLANFHHPHHMFYDGYNSKKYSADGLMKNNYWRVMGNMKFFEPKNRGDWSPYYKDAIRLHLALLPDSCSEVYNKFEDMKKAYDSTKDLLRKLTEFPVANIELLPYKSENISMSKFNKLLESECYVRYLKDIVTFIKLHTADNAYIIATNSVSKLYELYNFLRKHLMGLEEYTSKKNDLYTYCLCSRDFTQKEKHYPERAPMYLTKWGERKLIVTSPISKRNSYSWIYKDFSNGWVDAIKYDFP